MVCLTIYEHARHHATGFLFFFRHPGSEEPSRRKGMTGLGARRGEQHGRNGYKMDEVYRAIYLTGANGVASAVPPPASKKVGLRRNLGPELG